MKERNKTRTFDILCQVGDLVIEEKNSDNFTINLKNGKEIQAAGFFKEKGFIHGCTLKGDEFRCNYGEIERITPLTGRRRRQKKSAPKIAKYSRIGSSVSDQLVTAENGSADDAE